MTMEKHYAASPSGRDIHVDTPLTNLAIKAFDGGIQGVAPILCPPVPVGKQSDKYFVIDPNSWLRIPDTRRSPKTAPNQFDWQVSSDSYFADNFALRADNSFEDLDNADMAISLRENSTAVCIEALMRDYENRVASIVTSITNVGSGVALTGVNKWSDYVGSDPIADVTTAHAFITNNTGMVANTLVIDKDTYAIVRRHPLLLDMFKYTSGGFLNDDQLKGVFNVDQILIGRGVKNNALENATASITNIWGNNVILAKVNPAITKQTATFMLAFRWQPSNMPAPMQVLRYNDPDPGRKVEWVESGYYQDEKIVAKNLAYAITGTL
jgi:hypothetical protein